MKRMKEQREDGRRDEGSGIELQTCHVYEDARTETLASVLLLVLDIRLKGKERFLNANLWKKITQLST